MDWTEDSISLLRRLWDEGLSTAEIGRRMQVTKNAVVGKAHRLELPARPSPIRKMAEAAASPAAIARLAPLPASAPASATGGAATRRAETALDTGTVLGTVLGPVAATVAPAPVPAEVVTLSPPAPEPRRFEPAAAATPVPPASGTVHVLRPAMPATPPRSAEPDAIPDAVLPRPAAPAAVSAPVSAAASGAAPRRRGMTCCWPLGEPGTREFHFCGADPVPGKPYCAEHAAMAYVKVRDRRDSVA